MAVYVDSAKNKTPMYPHMVFSHMIADTHDELLAMVDAIGVQRKWIQKAGQYDEHFDIVQSKRALAIANGAKEVSPKELVAVLEGKRNGTAS